MSTRQHNILILGLGNEILGDDAVGLLAARELMKEFHKKVDIAEAAISGFEIMELLEGYEKVLLLDTVVTKKHEAGTIIELSKERFKKVVAVSPHYMGLPEIFQLAEIVNIDLPKEIRILAMEIEPPYDLRDRTIC
ncbi:MAG: hydrogenase maturation protease [Ignavibacteriales bacterium]|nr:hydrogenase maturation protease [Ignavibacteriales bacterium]